MLDRKKTQDKNFIKDISSLKDLKSLARDFVRGISPPQIVLLHGPLGVGKSQMVRFMGEALGVPEKDIQSPAFSLINIYESPLGPVSHVDLFRLKGREDLESTGFWDLFVDSAVIFIEWAELLQEELPSHWKKLYLFFEFSGKDQRILRWEKV